LVVVSGFVDKNQPFRELLQPWLTVIDQHLLRTDDISTIGFA